MRTLALVAFPVALLVVAGCGDDSDESGSGSYCDLVEEVQTQLDDDAEPAESLAAFERLSDAAPDELDDAFATLVPFTEALAEIDPDDVEAQIAALEDFDIEEIEAAGDQIAEVTEEECGIDLDDGGGEVDVEAPGAEDDTDG